MLKCQHKDTPGPGEYPGVPPNARGSRIKGVNTTCTSSSKIHHSKMSIIYIIYSSSIVKKSVWNMSRKNNI